jgi:hypothetical protein
MWTHQQQVSLQGSQWGGPAGLINSVHCWLSNTQRVYIQHVSSAGHCVTLHVSRLRTGSAICTQRDPPPWPLAEHLGSTMHTWVTVPWGYLRQSLTHKPECTPTTASGDTVSRGVPVWQPWHSLKDCSSPSCTNTPPHLPCCVTCRPQQCRGCQAAWRHQQQQQQQQGS